MPEQGKAAFQAEHARRFLRRAFKANLRKDREHRVELEPFRPDQKQHDPAPDQNDFSELLNEPAPAFACQDWYNTTEVSLESLRGKVVVLTFWAGFDDSPQGRQRIEALRAHYDLLRDDEEVFFLAIHDGSTPADEVEDYVHRFHIQYPVGRDTDDFTSFTAYNIGTIPQTDRKSVV